MPQKMIVPLPLHLRLGGNWIVEWDAVDPVTGASVPGVVVSGTSLHVEGSESVLANIPNPILVGAGAG